jgi:hypothetical protein
VALRVRVPVLLEKVWRQPRISIGKHQYVPLRAPDGVVPGPTQSESGTRLPDKPQIDILDVGRSPNLLEDLIVRAVVTQDHLEARSHLLLSHGGQHGRHPWLLIV